MGQAGCACPEITLTTIKIILMRISKPIAKTVNYRTSSIIKPIVETVNGILASIIETGSKSECRGSNGKGEH
ncbi:MAG: hypothetical protein Kow00121_07270 [Elainellaceae cyanobacterium]